MKKRNMLHPSGSTTLIIRSAAIALLSALIILTVAACSEQGQSAAALLDSAKLSALESKLASLQAVNGELESRLEEELSSLSSELDDLRNKLSESPSQEPETIPTDVHEYFGFKYKIEDGSVTIIGYEGSSSELIIPASIGGAKVLAIADSAFESCGFSSVSIPETVESIGWFAFRDCRSLCRAVIPKTVTEIGYSAFSGCASLTVYAPADSYVYKYAQSYGIPVFAER